MWFPKPSRITDVRIVGAGGALSRAELFEMLNDSAAAEWRDRIGVAGPVDGSAKSALRLLAARGWVLKTNTASAVSSAEGLVSQALVNADAGRRMRLWHPDKTWAVYLSGGLWYAANATPEIRTLRQISGLEPRIRAWTAMIEHCVRIAVDHGVCLDLNPSNFGRFPGEDRLHYVDDEWYPEAKLALIASGVVARIPEEPGAAEEVWRSWGQVLGGVLSSLCDSRERRAELVDCVAEHPVAMQFAPKRAALCDGLRVTLTPPRARSADNKPGVPVRKPRQRTAVIADVHGNRLALDAVLTECARLSVDSYIFLGDAVGYGPNPRGCVQRLAELPHADLIRGNHDHAIGTGVFKAGMNRLARSCAGWTHEQLTRDEREWLVSLPLDARGDDWLAVHGAPKDPHRFLAYVYELTFQENLEHIAHDNIRLCFCGHTHVQYVHERTAAGECRKAGTPETSELEPGRILLVNPGSVGQPRDGDARAAFAIWDRDRQSISLHRVPYAVEMVVESLRQLGLPHDLGERLLQGV